MSAPACSYCTDEAKGVDEDDEWTCGDCTPVAAPLPAITEISGEDNEDADE